MYLDSGTFLLYYGSPSLSVGETFQDPQWMPEAINSTEP